MIICEKVIVFRLNTSKGTSKMEDIETTKPGSNPTILDELPTNWVHSQNPKRVIKASATINAVRESLKIPNITKGARINAVIILNFKRFSFIDLQSLLLSVR